ncbi:M24 family metallopeptidase [Alienimonas californiensis]|uniref:Putative peptidase n=1 Tax=Alienimonas californiensis TaxID=2527989 RepID=A0A517P9D0_9PLAN|nr:Xaa-Pro peptidase family protein [Alienimonas californiensis]QDT15986.1 putative peptidase [Alienimonas californiensis]
MNDPSPPPGTYAARRDRLRAVLAEKHPDLAAVLVESTVNIRYLTGFTGSSARLLIGPDVERIVSDSRYAAQIEQQCPGLDATIRTQAESFAQSTAKVLSKQRGPVAVEAAHITLADFETLKGAAAGVPLLTSEGLVEGLRAIKDEWEIGRIRAAVAAAETAFTATLAEVRGDESERDLSHRLEAALRANGATGFSFAPIVAVGPGGAHPHYSVGDPQIADAGTLLVDWGARMPDGYVSDLTRTLVTGEEPDEFRRVYDTVNAAVDAALAVLRPGVPLKDVDAAARGVIEEAGFGEFFGHGTGHGIGLEVHEAPRLSSISEDLAAPGMVVTVEPGVYLARRFGVRIEEDVLVTPEGCQVLSSLPRREPTRLTPA